MSTNIIKKSFLGITLVMVLLFSMSLSVYASTYEEIIPKNTLLKGQIKLGEFVEETDSYHEYETEISLVKDEQGVINFSTKRFNGDIVNFKMTEYNGEGYTGLHDKENLFGGHVKKISDIEYELFLDMCVEGIGKPVYFTVKVAEETQSLATMFSGNTSSKWKEYDVALSGRIKGDFKEGVNELTADQIKEQTISAVLYNTLTDEIVTRNVNSITGVKVTVNNGKITNIEIDGKAKTPEGRADTYNAKIDL